MSHRDNVTFFSSNRFAKLANATSMRNHSFDLMAKAAATKAEQKDIQRFFNQINNITQAQQNHTKSPIERKKLAHIFSNGSEPRMFRRTLKQPAAKLVAPVIDNITPPTTRR